MMSRRRTYWHLEGLGRRPSDYDIATTRLLRDPSAGIMVRTPAAQWREAYNWNAKLSCDDWDSFDDPRAVTYAGYVAQRRDREVFIDELFRSAATAEDDRALSREWLQLLARLLGPLRYPCHGLQMASAQLGALAPSGKIAVLCAFQAADQLRAVHRLAQRMAMLSDHYPDLFCDSLRLWQEDPAWQPLRELTERLLVAHDGAEAFVGLCLTAKPAFDEIFFCRLAECAGAERDLVSQRMLGSLGEDSTWHHEWSAALARRLVLSAPGNARVLDAYIDRWLPLAFGVAEVLAPLVDRSGQDASRLTSRIRDRVLQHHSDSGLQACSTRGAV